METKDASAALEQSLQNKSPEKRAEAVEARFAVETITIEGLKQPIEYLNHEVVLFKDGSSIRLEIVAGKNLSKNLT